MLDKTLHIAIIPDGNRRWAKRFSLKPWQGHAQAMKNSRALIEWCFHNPRISALSLWGFSTENWNRSQEEVDNLMRIYVEWLQSQRSLLMENEIRFVHSGRMDRIPKDLASLIQNLTHETEGFSKFTLNFALDYGGRDEVARAIQKISEPALVTEQSFRQYLDHPELPDIDLVIRTSGEHRTSGFFIWQAAYAEWHFEKKYFPDLTPEDLGRALEDYDQRQRRFGK